MHCRNAFRDRERPGILGQYERVQLRLVKETGKAAQVVRVGCGYAVGM